MDSRYKVIISNKNLYKEVYLSSEANTVKVGTNIGCDFRLQKHLFFEAVELTFMFNDKKWLVICSDNLYITVGDVRKFMTKELKHGETLEVKYQESNNTVFVFEFLVDFDYGEHKLERRIDVSAAKDITIGASPSNNIIIHSQYILNDAIVLHKEQENLMLEILYTTYGVYHNGKKAENYEIIKNGDFFSISDFAFFFKDNVLWAEISDKMSINSYTYYDSQTKNNYPKFNRNTRIKTTVDDEKIEILDPPSKPQKPKNNIVTRLLPSMGMLIASGVMAFMGGAMIIFSAISGVMAIVTTVLSIIEGNKEYKQKVEERIEKYNNYIACKREEIGKYRDIERELLEEIYVSPDVEQERFRNFSSDLFDRTGEDEDFLCVRLGTGNVEAIKEINYKRQERLEVEDNLQEMPEKIYNEYKFLQNAPIVCDLKEANGVGVVGDPKNRFSILKNMVLDLAARQYHTDLKMFFIATEVHKKQIHWLRMLPHAYNNQIGIRNLVCDDESKNIIFEFLYKELSFREDNKKFTERYVVFFYDEYGFKNHPISKFIDKAKDLGVTFIFFADLKEEIPLGCDYIIDVNQETSGRLIKTEDKRKSLGFSFHLISDKLAEQIVQFLAPVYTEEISLEGTLTKNYSLFDMLNILSVDDLDLRGRWFSSKVSESMRAPIGISKSGVIELDLHDKAHGPHGLVAGTTGSGKSEILQTYILSMATLYHPYEVAFVIIDFKGGGMVNQFKELPHLLGAITNIDGKEINRSLKSIKAELKKRQRLFAEAEVNHIDKYIKKLKAGQVSVPLPHLIVIVDEFAELKAEQPDFMKELISAARIGRSLGVHLILATQKPSGQVNEQIWSNSRFKLCLKVQSQEDSNEVIKSPLAAEIKEPGRAYLQIGNNEIFELFQSAYSGAPEKTDDNNVKEFSIYALNDSGRRIPVYSQKKKKKADGKNLTQLDAIVKYVDEYCHDNRIHKLPDICLPSLEKVINFPADVQKGQGETSVIAEIGIYDDPDNQYQGVYSIDLTNQNVMIIGSAQSGKTNLLQTIIRSTTFKYSPDELNIYIIDFASMVLKNFENLRHVGGVVTASDDEKLKNLIKLLQTEIETRKEKMLSVGVSSFSAYREAGKTDLPQILLMIDNLTALKELYFQDDDVLLNICREGLSVGICTIIANSQTAGIGYKYLSNFSRRIALFCNDSGEYGSLFDHCSERIEDIHGRSLVEIDKTHLDCQIYLAFKGEKEIERVQSIKEFIAEINEPYKNKMARIIPVIPQLLTDNYVREKFGMFMQQHFKLVVGLDYDTVTPFTLNFEELGVLALSGKERSGKHNFVKYTVNMLDQIYPETSEVYVLDGIKRNLDCVKKSNNVVKYSVLPEDVTGMIMNIETQLAGRYSALAAGKEGVIETSKLLVLVIDNQDALSEIGNNLDVLSAYKNITTRYKNLNVCVLVSEYENVNITYGAPEVIKNIRDAKHFLFFDDIANLKIFDVPLATIRKFKKPLELGDCYYIKDNECVKVKSVLNTKI